MKSFALFFVAFAAILALNAFFLAPFLISKFDIATANIGYGSVRLAAYIVFSYLCARVYSHGRYQLMGATAFLAFVDQVVFKSILLWIDYQKNPAEWADHFSGALFGSAMGYMVFLPIILLLAFLGSEMHFFSKKSAQV